MKKTVFTIVAKNYFGFAKALYVSVKKQNPEVNFYVLISDEFDKSEDFINEEFTVLQAKDIGIPDFNELAFKYNITEHSTAIKPYFFTYLFNKGYEKVIYFDPDIYVYSNLDQIFDELDSHDIILTPHMVTAENLSTANAPETLTLFAGIYNLGFTAIKNTLIGREIATWWSARLAKYCFVDKFDALHVDQKWMDFVPALFGNSVLIMRDLGWNIAYWNIHERKVITKGENVTIVNRLKETEGDNLVFIHFSGFNPIDIFQNKQCPSLDLHQYADFIPYFENYAVFLQENNFNMYFHKTYSYATFQNGVNINIFQRRLYRRFIQEGGFIENPFAVGPESFYEKLRRNGLVSLPGSNVDKMNERNFEGLDKKIRLLNTVMKTLKKMLGFDKYVLLLKFSQRYFRPENQVFLIDELKDVKFINENVKR